MSKKNKAVLGGKTKLIVLIKNWVHQGFLYLDKTEMFYRVIWELIPFSIAFSLMLFLSSFSLLTILISAGFISHTLNWVFNDNFWTCIMFTFPNIKNPGEKKTIAYLAAMQKRMQKNKVITGCMIYGSLSRKKWQIKSDLDMRILRKAGVLYGLKAYLIVHKERLIALSKSQPLDLYMADGIPFLNKMREDEFPIFIKNDDSRLKKRYGTSKATDFTKVKHLNKIHNENI